MGKPVLATPPAPPRFQIASRLGGFRDTCTVGDPFGTPARFTVIRNGSNAHKKWGRERLDSDPRMLVIAERAMSADIAVPLTVDEQKTVEGARSTQDPTVQSLLGVVDRLSVVSAEQQLGKSAVRSLIEAGKIKPSDWSSMNEDQQLAEALFVLKTWDDMPDDAGGVVTYDQDAALALLTLDIPMEDSGIDLLTVDAWNVEITGSGAELPTGAVQFGDPDPEGILHWKQKIPNPLVQTVGQAYQLYFLYTSRTRSLFRDRLLDAAGKNSNPSSDSTISSGDGQKTDEPAN